MAGLEVDIGWSPEESLFIADSPRALYIGAGSGGELSGWLGIEFITDGIDFFWP